MKTVVIVGKPGSGKTTYWRKHYPQAVIIRQTHWRSLHSVLPEDAAEKVLVFEDFDSDHDVIFVLNLIMEKKLNMTRMMQRSIMVHPSAIVIVTNKHPRDWFGEKIYNTFKNDIDEIIHMRREFMRTDFTL
jgi:adenylate kinase